MNLAYLHRFPLLFAQVKSGAKPVCFFDQDGTLTLKVGANESQLNLHPEVIPAVKKIVAKGGHYIPSSARPVHELKAGYTDVPGLSFAGNDGYVIAPAGSGDVVYSQGRMPDFSVFQAQLEDFIKDMEGVTVAPMGAYFGLYIDVHHPDRLACEGFFSDKIGEVSALSNNLPMLFNGHPMGITMEPRVNRGKDGVIKYLMPLLDVKNPILISAGDGANDMAALKLTKELGGFAIKVRKGVLMGVPDYANIEVIDVEDCVGLLTAIAHYMSV